MSFCVAYYKGLLRSGKAKVFQGYSAETQRVRPIMTEILQAKGLVQVAEERVFVTGIKGPLEAGWEETVASFAEGLPVS